MIPFHRCQAPMIVFGAVLSLLVLSGCVEQNKFVALENRVAAMEMDNNRRLTRQNTLSRESEQKSQQNLSAVKADLGRIQEQLSQSRLLSREEYAQSQVDIQSILKQIQQIQGQIQELDHRMTLQSRQNPVAELAARMERLDMAVSKNYEKLIRLEKHVGFEPSAASVIEPVLPGDAQPPAEVSAADVYLAAKKRFDEGDMENARVRFENFITKYPDSDNADNARYWIAYSFYLEKRYAEAILEFQKVLEGYPGSDKLAAARLYQGYAFAELGENANARLILNELLKKFPDSQEAQFATEKLKSLQ